jgi:putative acetyltransferase
VFCLTEDDLVIGFIGVADKKIEMLFLDPKYFGQGLGKMLMNFAISELAADKVDVNEQNIKAVNFYKKFGFEIIERTEKDDQGRNYPLLRMKLK